MPSTADIKLDTPSFKGTITFNTGLFIDGKWVDPVQPDSNDVINPSTGKPIAKCALGSKADVDIAVKAAYKAYKTSWGLKAPGHVRGKYILKLADLLERDADIFAALESINVGKPYSVSRNGDVAGSIRCIRYFGGWADKIEGKTIEIDDSRFAYTRHEPFGVVGQIIPWNFPLLMLAWKVGPALATGNCIVLKPSEMTPLSALKFCDLVTEAGFPPGVVNIINGYGTTVGAAIAEHMDIGKVAFTGSTLVGRKVMEAAARTNLKVVTLELGGKSPSIVFDDCNLEETIKWAGSAMYINMGAWQPLLFMALDSLRRSMLTNPASSFSQVNRACTSSYLRAPAPLFPSHPGPPLIGFYSAGTRLFVQEGVYDEFVEKYTAMVKGLAGATGDPFAKTTQHGPQVSQSQFDRVMDFIASGKSEGAKVSTGGIRHGTEGYFIEPTVFTDVQPEMKIAKEEIFGPVVSIMKFKDEADVIEKANDTVYGLACYVYTENVKVALRVVHALEAGSAFVNTTQMTDASVAFGGFKQSGIGREHGEYALNMYTQVKGVHVNLSMKV
ncbi:Aldehyde dehydrogenase [Mycena kentingensis (nom. inval.)]|nr:Aldehyde dehydrogenase [Mycena kentingensis (nom. inval.)]